MKDGRIAMMKLMANALIADVIRSKAKHSTVAVGLQSFAIRAAGLHAMGAAK